MAVTYSGFSTYNRSKKFVIEDFELAKQDLFNYLNIKKGEKLMNPNFGTIIWGMLFEPLTTEVRTAITNDINTIINYDPRISADKVTVSEYQNGIQIMLELRYIPTNQTDLLQLNFDRTTV